MKTNKKHAYIILFILIGIFAFSLIYQFSMISSYESLTDFTEPTPSPSTSETPIDETEINIISENNPRFDLAEELYFVEDANSVIYIKDILVEVVSVKVEMKRESTGEVFNLFSYSFSETEAEASATESPSYSPTPESSPSSSQTGIYFFNYKIPVYINSGLLINNENYIFSFEIKDINGRIYTEEKKVTARLFIFFSADESMLFSENEFGPPSPPEAGEQPPPEPEPQPSATPFCIVESLSLRRCIDKDDTKPDPETGKPGQNSLEDVGITDTTVNDLINEIEAYGKGEGKCTNWDSPDCFMIIGVVRASSLENVKLCKEGQEVQTTIWLIKKEGIVKLCAGPETPMLAKVPVTSRPNQENAHCFGDNNAVKKCPNHDAHSKYYSCDDYHEPKFSESSDSKSCYLKYHRKMNNDKSDNRYLVIWSDNPQPRRASTDTMKINGEMRFHSYLWSNNCKEHQNKCFEIKYVYEKIGDGIPRTGGSFEPKDCVFY